MRWVIGVAASLAVMWGSASGCTLGSEIYEETGASHAGTIMAAVRILTGKDWNALDEETQRKLIRATATEGATHAATINGVERIETFLTDSSLSPGRYRISGANEEGGFIKVRLGRREYWIEERYSCYSIYSYDILVWNGYGGQLCSEAEYDPSLGSC